MQSILKQALSYVFKLLLLENLSSSPHFHKEKVLKVMVFHVHAFLMAPSPPTPLLLVLEKTYGMHQDHVTSYRSRQQLVLPVGKTSLPLYQFSSYRLLYDHPEL